MVAIFGQPCGVFFKSLLAALREPLRPAAPIPMLYRDFVLEKDWGGDLPGMGSGFPAKMDRAEFLAERGRQLAEMGPFLSVPSPRHPEMDFFTGDLHRSFQQVSGLASWIHVEKDFFVYPGLRRFWIRKKREKPPRVFYLLK